LSYDRATMCEHIVAKLVIKKIDNIPEWL
jgi:hypothetical protein